MNHAAVYRTALATPGLLIRDNPRCNKGTPEMSNAKTDSRPKYAFINYCGHKSGHKEQQQGGLVYNKI